MAITYPLTMPGFPAPASVRIMQQNLVAVSSSQFTGLQQVQQWPGEWWEAEWSLPPVANTPASPWRGFLAGLRGQAGTFLMGPGAVVKPRGSVGSRPNLVRLSSNFPPSSIWANAGGVSIANTGPVSPYGGGSQTVTFAANSLLYQDIPSLYVPGQTFTASIWVYAAGAVNLYLGLESGTTGLGQVVTVTAGSWQRVSATITFPSDMGPRRGLYFAVRNTDGFSKTVNLWGAQLERGTAVTAYYGDENFAAVSATPGSKTMEVGGYGSLAGTGGWLLSGDYFQLGNHLYMAVTDSAVSSNGNTVDVFPALRSDAAAGANIFTADPVGLWRLSDNQRGFSLATGSVHEFSGIKCREAI